MVAVVAGMIYFLRLIYIILIFIIVYICSLIFLPTGLMPVFSSPSSCFRPWNSSSCSLSFPILHHVLHNTCRLFRFVFFFSFFFPFLFVVWLVFVCSGLCVLVPGTLAFHLLYLLMNCDCLVYSVSQSDRRNCISLARLRLSTGFRCTDVVG